MTSIPTFALRGFSENQYGGHMGTTSQQVTNLTLKVYEKQLELVGNLSYQGKFQWNFDQGKGNLVRANGEFELSEFYCTFKTHVPYGYEPLSWLEHLNKVVMGRLLSSPWSSSSID